MAEKLFCGINLLPTPVLMPKYVIQEAKKNNDIFTLLHVSIWVVNNVHTVY